MQWGRTVAGGLLVAGCRLNFEQVSDDTGRDAQGSATSDAALDASTVDAPPLFVYPFESESGVVTAPFMLQTMAPVTYAIDGNASGTMGAGGLEFTVIFDTPGTYYLWANMLTQTATSDALAITLAGNTAVLEGADCMYSSNWHWVGVRTSNACPAIAPLYAFNVGMGATVVTVSSREGGTMVDRFLLTNDPAYVP